MTLRAENCMSLVYWHPDSACAMVGIMMWNGLEAGFMLDRQWYGYEVRWNGQSVLPS